jgi:hypothetical protein
MIAWRRECILNCPNGAKEISPGLEQRDYPGKTSHKIILPLLAERGEGRGEESTEEFPDFAMTI